jgi:membrane protein
MLAELAALELRRLSRRRVRGGAEAVWGQFAEHDLLTYSSAISFQMLYAAIPIGLLTLAAMGLVGAESLYTDHIAPALHRTLSHDAYGVANRTALKVLNGERLWWSTLGLAVTLWGAGAALRSMMTPLNRVYGAEERRSWLRRIAVSVLGGALAIACVLGAILIALVAPLWNLHGAAGWLFWAARWAATVLLLFAAIATLLWVVPAKKRPVEWISVGSALCAVCWIVATLGFGAYISAVSYQSFYGATAGVVLLLIYLHVSAIAFLLGVVVDALLREEVRKQERRSRAAAGRSRTGRSRAGRRSPRSSASSPRGRAR